MSVTNATDRAPPDGINVGACVHKCSGAVLDGKCLTRCPTLYTAVSSNCTYVTCQYDVKWVLIFSGAAFVLMLLVGLALGLPIGIKVNRRRLKKYQCVEEEKPTKSPKEVKFCDSPIILDKKPLEPIIDEDDDTYVYVDVKPDMLNRFHGSFRDSPQGTRRQSSNEETEMELEPLVCLNNNSSPPTPSSLSRSPTQPPPRYSRSTSQGLSPHKAHIHDIIQRYRADFHYILNSVAWNFTTPDKVGRTNYVHDNFAIGIFTKDGGYLQLPNLGASLYVPPGAVPDGEEREIYMYLSWNNRDLPPMVGSCSPLGPVLLLGEHGQRFLTHLVLTFPMSVSTIEGDWSVVVMRTDTDTGEIERWSDVTESGDTLVIPGTDNTCQMLLSHFTGANVAARADQGAVKHMKVGVFGGQLEADDLAYTFRVHCWNEGLTEYVTQKEARFQASSLDDHERTIDLANNGRGLVVRITHYAPGWEMNTLKQEISFSHVWNQYYESVTFNASRTTEKSMKQFFCTVEILQKDTEDSACYRVLSPCVKISSEQIKESKPTSERKHLAFASSDRVLYDLDDCLQPTAQVAVLLPMCMSHRLAILLDPRSPDGRDWTMLAELCGLSPECIRWLLCQRTSPTQKVLDIIAAKHAGSALSVLKEYLYQMGHDQALAILDSYESNDSDSESHTTDQSDETITPRDSPSTNHRDANYQDDSSTNDHSQDTPTNSSQRGSSRVNRLHQSHETNAALNAHDDTRGSYSSESGYGSPTSTMPKMLVAVDINPKYASAQRTKHKFGGNNRV